MAAVALINSTHKMDGSSTRPLREQNVPPSSTQGKSFQKIRNIHESLRAGLAKRSSVDLRAEGEPTVKLSKAKQRDTDDGKRRLLGLGLRRTESKAGLGQGGARDSPLARGWTPFRAPTLRIATLSSPDLKNLANGADVTLSIDALVSAPKTKRPSVHNITQGPPPSTPSRTQRQPSSPVSHSPTPRRRPTVPSSSRPDVPPETRSRSTTVSTQTTSSASVSRTTSPVRPPRHPPPLLPPTPNQEDEFVTSARPSNPSSPRSGLRSPTSPPITSRASSRGHQPHDSTGVSSPTVVPFWEEIRAAASFIVKELSRQPPQIKDKDWIEVEMRLRPLVRAERMWAPNGTGAAAGNQLGSPSSRGAERERRVFGDALRDGVVLCQFMNKLRPGIVSRVGYKEDGSRNIRNFLYATARYGADPSEMFQDEDLLESTPEAMGSVANGLLYLAQLIEEERQSLVVIHDGGKAKSTLYVSASRIVSKTEPVQFDEKPGGMSQANGGRSPYGTLGRQMGVMSNPELASKARAISPTPSTKGRDKSPPPKISPPIPLGHRPSQHRHNGLTVRPNRTPAGSPIPSAPSSPKPAPLSRTASHSPRMTRVVIPESRRTSSPLLDRQRNEGRRSSNGARPLSNDSNAPPQPPSRSPDHMGSLSTFAKQRQSATSIVTNSSLMTESTAAFSSLLDFRSGGYGTMRTTTTEATSPSSGIPSFSRSEANEAAKAVMLADSPKAMRRRLSDIGNPYPDRSSPLSPSPEDLVPGSSPSHLSHLRLSRRDRRSSEAAVDLTRVNEETEEPSVQPSKLLARRRSKILDSDPSKRVARKWPEDFDSALEVDSNPIEELERELMGESNSSTTHLEAKPPPVLAPIRIPSPRANVPQPLLSDEPRPSRPILVPRRSKRYSADSGIIPSPREGLLRANSRDASPAPTADSSGLGAGRPPMIRQPSSRNGKRVYVPKGSTPPSSEISERILGQRASPGAGPSPLSTGLPLVSPHVPFPRRASAEFNSGGASRLPTLPSSSETLREDAAEKDQAKDGQPAPEPRPQRPHVPRGRHQSEFDSQRKKLRPGSMDEIGVRRSRIESMFEGVRSEEKLAQPPPSRGQIPRRVLVVKEEGQPAIHYSLGDCIGKGQFGSVYRALNLTTGQMVAVKQLALDGLSAEEVKSLEKEVDLLKSLSHPSIVKYEGMAQDEEHLSIVLEYVENGSLGQTLKAFGKLNEKLVASYVIRILEGLHYLHQCSVVHCDLKAANILTTKNGNVKLSDFGVSLNLHAMEKVNEVAGTPNWMAPEVIELKGASTKSDIWSLGCVIVELLTGRPPYGDIPNGLTVMFRIVEDERPPIPEGFSPMLRNFLELCFNKDPDLRPSAAILFEHPWLKQKWGAYKELRPQDSIPFLRRVSADLQRSDAVRHLAASLDPTLYNGGALEDSQYLPLARPTIAIPHHSGANTPLEHHFSTNSFSKPMDCNICYEPVRKHALICDHCRIIVHLRCKAESSILACERRHGMRSPRYDGSTPHSPTSGVLSSSPPSHPETLLRASPSGYNKIVGNWKKRSSRAGSPEPGQTSNPANLTPGRTPSITHSRDSEDRTKNRSSVGSTRRTSSLHSAATGVSALASAPEPVPLHVAAPQRLESKVRHQHRRQVSEAPSTRAPSEMTGTRSDVTDRRIRKRDSQNTKHQDGCVLQ